MNAEKKKIVILECMMVIAFIMNEFSNVVSFYLTGNTDDTIRKIISWGITFSIAAILCLYMMFHHMIRRRKIEKTVLSAILPFGITVLVLVWAIIKHNGQSFAVKEFIWCILYSAPLVSVAVYAKMENRLKEIMHKSIYVTLIMLPYYLFSIFYFWNLTIALDTGDGFGGLSYLGIGYSAVVLYTFLCANLFVTDAQSKKGKIQITISILEMLICAAVIVLSGSRGVLVAWLVGGLIAVIYCLFKKRIVLVIGVVVSLIGVIAPVILTPVNNASIYRQFMIISEIKQGSLSEALVSSEGEKLVEIIEENANNGVGLSETVIGIRDKVTDNQLSKEDQSVDNSSVEQKPVIEDANSLIVQEPVTEIEQVTDNSVTEEQPISGEKTDVTNENACNDNNSINLDEVALDVTNGSMARVYLFRLAITEALKSPMSGLGPMGFQAKYKMYPHNIVFEAFSDFGIIGGVVFSLICIWLVIKFIKYAISDLTWGGMLVILSAQAVKYCLSGDLYLAPILLFAFAMVILESRNRKLN